MYPRGHRGVGALVMLLVLVLSAMALLPSRAQAQTNQVTGLVWDCQTTYIPGALVTLTDANGIRSPQTVTTDGAGAYVFTPPASNYSLSVTMAGYYSNGTATPFRYDGTTTVIRDICLTAQPAATKTVTLTVKEQATGAPVGGASLSFYNVTRLIADQTALVTTVTLNSTTNVAYVNLWSGEFEMRVYAGAFAPNITPLNVTPSTLPITVNMTAGVTVVGHARDSVGRLISAGLVGFLYNKNAANASGTKVINAVVNQSLYTFHAPAGNYSMIIDANGYQAKNTSVTLMPGTWTIDAFLQPAPQVLDQVTVLFGPKDWNNLTVYRNLTLSPDSPMPGLSPANLRDLRLQILYTLTSAQDDVFGAGAQASFLGWLYRNGPLYTTTDGFLSVNGKAYNSSATSYQVSVSDMTIGGKVWINTSATYTPKALPYIAYGLSKYYVNVTMYPDSNTTTYYNRVYLVQLPMAYEMASSTIVPPVTTANYTRITLDPGVPASPSTNPAVRMIVEKSLSGTARAKVTGPVGKFHVVNATYQGYKAYVAANTSLNFSAQDSTDPVGDITKANFTWKMKSNASIAPQDTRYGITPTFTYASPGEYVVNLTVVQAGGNETYRNITLWVDDQLPAARIRTNLTGTGSANNATLKINQGTTVKFDGALSTDLAYAGKNGVILDGGYAWDFNGDRITDATGRTINWTFNKPGTFDANLTVTDGVGWKGVNATVHVQVNDTQGPTPAFDVLDPANSYAVVPRTSLVEKKTYAFNASKTTDNYDKLSALSFTWTIPGPLIGYTGTNRTFTGMNITFAWDQWNLSYAVKLSVKDTGFGSDKPIAIRGNYGNLTLNLTVQVDSKIRPDTKIDAGSMKIDNTNPEEGQTITITVNVTNKPGKGPANNLLTTVYEISSTQTITLTTSPVKWTDKNGADITGGNHSIASGSTVTLTFQVVVQGQGNKTIKVLAYDRDEPYTWVTAENRAQQSIVVRQPGWVNYAIAGSVIGVFAVFIFAMYYRRKVKAGDWQPLRGRRGKKEKGEGEEKRPKKEKEVKEEKKRL